MSIKKSYFLALSISLAAAIAISFICKSDEVACYENCSAVSIDVILTLTLVDDAENNPSVFAVKEIVNDSSNITHEQISYL